MKKTLLLFLLSVSLNSFAQLAKSELPKPGVISGKVKDASQFVMAGFEVEEKIHMLEAYERYPDQRLSQRDDGQLAGNIILDERGMQHPLDDHKNFEGRIDNYILGRSPIILTTDSEQHCAEEYSMWPAIRMLTSNQGDCHSKQCACVLLT